MTLASSVGHVFTRSCPSTTDNLTCTALPVGRGGALLGSWATRICHTILATRTLGCRPFSASCSLRQCHLPMQAGWKLPVSI